MGYILVSDFKLGVDRSRPIYAGQPGSIWSGINGHLTRGGDFEKRKIFKIKYELPAGTFGLATQTEALYTFGSAAAPGGLPAGVNYQRLQHPDAGRTMTSIVWVERFNGKLFVIAQYDDGTLHYFYDGTIIQDFLSGIVRTAMVDNAGIASHLKTLLDADTTKTTTRVGAVLTITHNTLNTAFAVTTTTLNKTGGVNDQTAVAVKTTAAAPGIAEVWTVTIGGTFEAGDRFNVALGTPAVNYGYVGNPTERPTVARTLGRKIYAAGAAQLCFTGVDTAIGWTDTVDAGAGQINMSNHLSGSETINALAIYQSKISVISRRVLQIWNMFADPAANSQGQVLEAVGSRAPGSVRSFGDLDVFLLSDSGIRSLRARDINLSAGVNDVGTLIDTLVRDWILSQLTPDATVQASVSVIEPLDGRYWLSIGTRIFVFTYFPSKKISAWSWYEPGFTVSAFATANDRIYARSGDTIYLYGGDDNASYDDTKVTLTLPFLTSGKPGTFKEITGVDIAATGTWNVAMLVDPNDEAIEEEIGDLTGVTFGLEQAAAVGHHSHVAPKLTHQAVGYASVSGIAVYFQGADSPGATP